MAQSLPSYKNQEIQHSQHQDTNHRLSEQCLVFNVDRLLRFIAKEYLASDADGYEILFEEKLPML